jgi:hypothetical protein
LGAGAVSAGNAAASIAVATLATADTDAPSGAGATSSSESASSPDAPRDDARDRQDSVDEATTRDDDENSDDDATEPAPDKSTHDSGDDDEPSADDSEELSADTDIAGPESAPADPTPARTQQSRRLAATPAEGSSTSAVGFSRESHSEEATSMLAQLPAEAATTAAGFPQPQNPPASSISASPGSTSGSRNAPTSETICRPARRSSSPPAQVLRAAW